jgi:CIC family chloride channel protein
VSRRGYHLTREYQVDPLEILFVREIVRTNVVALPASAAIDDVRRIMTQSARDRHRQRLYPLVDEAQRLTGVVTRNQLEQWLREGPAGSCVAGIAEHSSVVAYPDEPLRAVVHRMAQTGFTRFPVVERGSDRKLIGMISLADLLEGRRQNLEAEQRRERVLSLRLAFPRRLRRTG